MLQYTLHNTANKEKQEQTLTDDKIRIEVEI